MVGRQDLHRLLALHERKREDGGGVIALTGLAGVGKTALLESLRRDLAARGELVLFGRAEAMTTASYAPLREPAQQALTFLEHRGVASQFLDEHGQALGVLVPALSSGLGTGALDRTGFFESLRAFLVDLGRLNTPTVLLGGVHFADDDTRDLIRFLASHLFNPNAIGTDPSERFSGVLVVAGDTSREERGLFVNSWSGDVNSWSGDVNSRSGDVNSRSGDVNSRSGDVNSRSGDVNSRSGDVNSWSGDVNSWSDISGARVETLEVTGLNRSDLIGYLADHPALDRLLAASRGRPEDVDELLESLPEDAESYLQDRIGALPELGRRAAFALAVAGRPCPPDVLAAVIEADTKDVAKELALLVERGLLSRRLVNGELLFQFARTHHQESLRKGLERGDERSLNGRFAKVLEARHERSDIVPLLARHHLAGEVPADGIVYAIEAVDRLVATFAYGSAVHLIKRALQFVDSGDDRFQLVNRLVEAERQRGKQKEALAAAEEMRGLARGEQLGPVLRVIGELTMDRGDQRAAAGAPRGSGRAHGSGRPRGARALGPRHRRRALRAR